VPFGLQAIAPLLSRLVTDRRTKAVGYKEFCYWSKANSTIILPFADRVYGVSEKNCRSLKSAERGAIDSALRLTSVSGNGWTCGGIGVKDLLRLLEDAKESLPKLN